MGFFGFGSGGDNGGGEKGGGSTTPQTVPNSPFFQPSTPHVVVVQQTPRGTRKSVEVKRDVQEHKSTILGCTSNLVNAIVGSGIVGIPYAIQQAGFVSGVCLIALCAVLTEKSLRLLVATAKHVHVGTYETTAEAAFGVHGFRFIVINMFIMSYGAMLSYLMVVKDSYSVMVGIRPDDLPQKRAVLFVVSILIMVPIASRRDMADLAITSRFNVVIDTLLVGLVAYSSVPGAPALWEEQGWDVRHDIIRKETIFVGLGVLSFAFVCQHSAFLVAGSLERPTIRRWSTVTGIALVVCGVLALTCGITGYLGHLQYTQGNILNSLDPSSWTANVARGMLGTTMLFVYPLESFVARHVCVVLLFSGRRAHEGDDANILNRRDRRIGLTVALYIISVLPAALFENMGNVLAFTGAIGGSCLSYIGPGLLYLGVHGGRFLELLEKSWLGSMLPANNSSNRGTGTKNAGLGPVTHSVETTPLVATTREAEEASAEVEKGDGEDGQENESECFPLHMIKAAVWYITLCPVWVYLAKNGRVGLTKHIHDLAIKSPHPIRIGDVEYSRALVNQFGRIHADPEKAAVLWPYNQGQASPASGDGQSKQPPVRSGSDIVSYQNRGQDTQEERSPLPFLAVRNNNAGRAIASDHMLGRSPGASKQPMPSVNQQIGQGLLLKQQQDKKQAKKAEHAIEVDPQEAPPSWYDFFVAIFFILFGVLAMVAGLGSLFMKTDVPVARRW